MPPKPTCGHWGGKNKDGSPCTRKAGWGRNGAKGRCRDHETSMAEKARAGKIVERPHDWDSVLNVAFWWLLTENMKASADNAGVGYTTVKRWRHSEWWWDACDAVKDRWLKAGVGLARRGLLKNIKNGDGASQRWLLERGDPDLAPPGQTHRITIEYMHKSKVVELMAALGADVAELIEDVEIRQEIVIRARARMQPLLGESFTPTGEDSDDRSDWRDRGTGQTNDVAGLLAGGEVADLGGE